MKVSKWLFSFFFIFAGVPFLLGGALYWLNGKGFFNLEKIEVLVEGGDLSSNYLRPQVEAIENIIETLRGQSLWNIDLENLKTQIQNLNWVEDIILVRQWPQTLRAKIKPYDVKMLLLTKKNEFMPIVKNGEVLSPIDIKNLPDSIVLRGEIFQRDIKMRSQAVNLLAQIPKEGSFSRAKVSEIFYQAKEGFWVTLIRSGIEVRLGQEHVPLKSARVSQVLDYLESHQFDARVIDADLSQKVLVRLRKGP